MKSYLEINGEKTPLSSLFLPEMNLSSARSKMHKESFKLFINKNELTEALESNYKDWVEESKADDLQCGSPQDELAKANYPTIEKVAGDPNLSELVFGSYLIRELFEKLIVTKKPKKPYHWLDEVSHCIIDEENVQFVGICYRK